MIWPLRFELQSAESRLPTIMRFRSFRHAAQTSQRSKRTSKHDPSVGQVPEAAVAFQPPSPGDDYGRQVYVNRLRRCDPAADSSLFAL